LHYTRLDLIERLAPTFDEEPVQTTPIYIRIAGGGCVMAAGMHAWRRRTARAENLNF
jgi:hypothetical protein